MAKIKPLFRVLAIVNALLLLGAYVCYRGGVVQAFTAKPTQRAVQGDSAPPVVQTPTPPKEGDSSPVPDKAETAATETPHRTEISNISMFPGGNTTTTQQHQEFFGGSKSMVVNIEPPAKEAPIAADPNPASHQPTRKRRVILSGSKSSPVDIPIEIDEPVVPESQSAQPVALPAQPTPEQLEAVKREILMSGSKSEIIHVDATKPAAAQPQQQQAAPRQQQAAPVQRRRAIMGGSKSAPIELDPQEKQ